MKLLNKEANVNSRRQIIFTEAIENIIENHLLLKTKYVGICTSDCKNYLYNDRSYFGHELVGEVLVDFEDLHKGDHVVVFHKHGCMKCSKCSIDSNLCSSPNLVPVGFKRYLQIPKQSIPYSVYKLPKQVDYKEFVFLDSFSCVWHALKKINFNQVDSILITGTGFMSILFALALYEHNVSINLFGTNRKKNELIERKLSNFSLIKNVDELKEYDLVIETTGKKDVLDNVVKSMKPKSQLLCFSNFKEDINITALREDEINILFSKHTTKDDIYESINWLQRNNTIINSLITTFYSLDSLEEIINQTLTNQIIRGAIKLE